jgi:hypothetical protein
MMRRFLHRLLKLDKILVTAGSLPLSPRILQQMHFSRCEQSSSAESLFKPVLSQKTS